MKRFLAGIAIGVALGTAIPASAQYDARIVGTFTSGGHPLIVAVRNPMLARVPCKQVVLLFRQSIINWEMVAMDENRNYYKIDEAAFECQ
jgi:hypothetical protein